MHQLEGERAEIYRWAYRLLRNHDDALDATQNVLLKALAQPPGPVEPSRAWLRRVTINHCVDMIRQRRRPTGPAASASQNAAGGALDELVNMERRHAVAGALEQLSETQRAVLIAKAFDAETFEAIARSLSLSPSTVKTHYLRGLRRMRDLLGAQLESQS